MIIGHEQRIEDFKRLAERNGLSHGYLFVGPARVGKKLFALCFANFLETGNFGSPALISGEEMKEGKPNILTDALLLEPDEERTTRGEHGRTIGINEIRRIRNFLLQKPIASKKRIVVINDAETLTREAQNALLKIAEEPPESSLLILIARDPEKLLPTLQSRLQKIYFSSVPLPLIVEWLKEKFDGDRQKVQSAAELSSGQPGLAWRMLFDERFGTLRKSGEAFLKSGFWARREIIKAILDTDDFDLGEFLEMLLIILSFDQFDKLRVAPRNSRGDKIRMASRVEPSQEKFSQKTSLNLWHKILELRRNADYLNLNPRLQLENLLNE